MIKSFKDKVTSDLFHGISSSRVQRLPTQILESALYKLDILNAAATLDDLRFPPGNRLEALTLTIHDNYKNTTNIFVNENII